jgi:hypothetical protein
MVVALDPPGDAVLLGPRLARFGSREGFRSAQCKCAAVLGERAAGALRRLGAADCRAEVHQGLGKIPGPAGWGHRDGRAANFRFAGQRVQAGNDPLDIGIDGRGVGTEGDRRDGRRRIVADARKLAQLRLLAREAALLGDGAGAGDEVAGARVIAEARPFLEHVGIGSGG